MRATHSLATRSRPASAAQRPRSSGELDGAAGGPEARGWSGEEGGGGRAGGARPRYAEPARSPLVFPYMKLPAASSRLNCKVPVRQERQRREVGSPVGVRWKGLIATCRKDPLTKGSMKLNRMSMERFMSDREPMSLSPNYHLM